MKSMAVAVVVIVVIAAGAYMILGEQPFGAADRTTAQESVRLD